MLAMLVLQIGLDVLRPWPLKILLDDILEKQAPPAEIQSVVDRLPGPTGVEGVLLWVCISTVLIVFARALTDMVHGTVSVTLGQRMVYDLAADLFRHLQRLSLLFHSRQPVGDTIARVTTDTYCLQTLVNTALLPLLQSVLELAAMFLIMWHIEPTLTLLSLGVVPLLMVCMWVFGGVMEKRGRKERDAEGRLVAAVEQALNAIPAVQAFTREELEQERFRRYAEEAVAAHRQSTQVDMWFKLLIGVLTAAGVAVIMWLGGRYALQGKVTAGTIIVFLSYLESLYAPLNAIVYTGSLVRHAAGSANRVLEILDTPVDVADRPGAKAPALRGHVRYEDVTFGYEPGRPVITGVSLEARPGS
jgi:ATP-binding cassette subfamily B protein/subfamily B ATP-binding cassette protein MsbA